MGNSLLAGIDPKTDMPTFVVSLDGLPSASLEQELNQIGYLQSLAPVFRVVALTDRDIFSLVRPFGWPVEHFAAPELAHQIHPRSELVRYRRRRLEIIFGHYANAQLIEPRQGMTLSAQLIEQLGLPDIAGLPNPQITASLHSADSGLPLTVADLVTGNTATHASSEGTVNWHIGQVGSSKVSKLLLTCGDISTESVPSEVTVVGLDFTPESTTVFEAFVYETIISKYSPDLSLVLPRQLAATTLPNTRSLIDIALQREGSELIVADSYKEHYEILCGSTALNWPAADEFAYIRRIARALATTRWG